MTAYIYPGLQQPDEIICRSFGIDTEQIMQKTRNQPVVDARRFAMFYARQYRPVAGQQRTYSAIGDMYGDKDHATAIHGVKTAQELIKSDRAFREKAIRAMRELCPEVKNFL